MGNTSGQEPGNKWLSVPVIATITFFDGLLKLCWRVASWINGDVDLIDLAAFATNWLVGVGD